MSSCSENLECKSTGQHDRCHDCDGSELKAEAEGFFPGLEKVHKRDGKGNHTGEEGNHSGNRAPDYHDFDPEGEKTEAGYADDPCDEMDEDGL